ncbi:MAG: alpha/beta hydrolase [Thermomicrobiales bacterium]
MKRRSSEWEFETNGITTVVSEWGAGDRHAVLLHGVSGNRHYWSDIGPQLASEGWHVFAPDLRGAGESRVMSDDQVGRDIQMYVEDLKSWTEELGLESFTLAGHSFGGRLTVDFTAKYPSRVNKMILIAAAGPDALNDVGREHPELVQQGGGNFSELSGIKGHVVEVLQKLRDRQPDRPATRAVMRRWLENLEIGPDGQAQHQDITATAEAQMQIIRTDDQTPLLADLNQPTVVLRSVDESAMLRYVIPHYAEQIPHATFVDDVPGGHDTPTASPEYVLQAFSD